MPRRFGGAPCDASGSACISTCETCPFSDGLYYSKTFGNGELYVCVDGSWQVHVSNLQDLCGVRGYTDPDCTIRYEAGADASSD